MNYISYLQASVMAEHEWQKHLREVVGIDISDFPSEEVFIPELGIKHRMVFYPDKYKEMFHTWLHEKYFPWLMSEGETEPHKSTKPKCKLKQKKHRKK